MTTKSLTNNLALLATCAGFSIVILDVSVVNVALAEIKAAFSSDITGLEWIVNGYTLIFAAFLLSTGALTDHYGAKRVFQAGFIVFALASLACGLAQSVTILILARLIQGLGAALLVPASLAIINQTFTASADRSRAVSLWAAAGGMALALGPLIGGMLISQSGWRLIFIVNVPIAVAGVCLTAVNTPATQPARGRKVDWAGQITAVLALGAMTSAIIEAGSRGWNDALVLGCIALFVIATGLFVISERLAMHPMLPLAMFRVSNFRTTALIGIGVNFAFYGQIFVFSLFFQSGWHYTPMATGIAFLPMTAAIMAANLAASRLARQFGPRLVLISGCLIATAGYLSLIPAIDAGSAVYFVVQFAVIGLGIGLAVPSMTTVMLSAVEPSYIGIAAGALNASRQIGGLIGVATTGLLLGQAAGDGIGDALPTALSLSSLLLVISAALAISGLDRAEKAPLALAAKASGSTTS